MYRNVLVVKYSVFLSNGIIEKTYISDSGTTEPMYNGKFVYSQILCHH